MSNKVVLGITGSIAAYKSADIVRRLKEKGIDLSVIMTKEAEHFITPLTIAALSGKSVYSDMFPSDAQQDSMPHITLAQEASVIVIAPATANTIAKIANGMADDLLSCVVMATQAKILIAPAMNVEMYQNPIVQENCTKLKSLGYQFIEPIEGELACGSTGVGHIADVDDIVEAVLKSLSWV